MSYVNANAVNARWEKSKDDDSLMKDFNPKFDEIIRGYNVKPVERHVQTDPAYDSANEKPKDGLQDPQLDDAINALVPDRSGKRDIAEFVHRMNEEFDRRKVPGNDGLDPNESPEFKPKEVDQKEVEQKKEDALNGLVAMYHDWFMADGGANLKSRKVPEMTDEMRDQYRELMKYYRTVVNPGHADGAAQWALEQIKGRLPGVFPDGPKTADGHDNTIVGQYDNGTYANNILDGWFVHHQGASDLNFINQSDFFVERSSNQS